MGMRAAQEDDLLGARQPDVGDELATAAQMAVVLLAQDRCADAVFARCRLHRPASLEQKRFSAEDAEDAQRSRWLLRFLRVTFASAAISVCFSFQPNRDRSIASAIWQ